MQIFSTIFVVQGPKKWTIFNFLDAITPVSQWVMFQISEIAIASTKLSSMFEDSSQKSPKLRLWLIKGFKHKNLLLRYGFPRPKSTLSNCPVQFRICIALTGLQNLKGGMQYLVSLASGGVSIFGKQMLGNQRATRVRLAKLYTGYMALGYIARHTWLYSHRLYSLVYMAI